MASIVNVFRSCLPSKQPAGQDVPDVPPQTEIEKAIRAAENALAEAQGDLERFCMTECDVKLSTADKRITRAHEKIKACSEALETLQAAHRKFPFHLDCR